MTSFLIALAMLAQTASLAGERESLIVCVEGPRDTIVVARPSIFRPLALAVRPQGPAAARAAPADEWFAADKVRHFGVAFAVSGFAYAGLRAVDVNRDVALAGAGATGLLAGLGKELYDRHSGRSFSIPDLVWDVVGIVAAMAVLDRTR